MGKGWPRYPFGRDDEAGRGWREWEVMCIGERIVSGVEEIHGCWVVEGDEGEEDGARGSR